MEKLQLMHKEINEKCFEIPKSRIAEDKQLKRWTIDKDALLQNLPEHVAIHYLDFLGKSEPVFRSIYLKCIKEGTMIIHCD